MTTMNPFLPSQHGHPNFNPTKSVGHMKNIPIANTDGSKNPKQPKPPDKPLMPYMRYSKKIWDDVRAKYPDLKVWEISKIVGQMWRDLDENEKQKYVDEFEAEKNEYNELLKQYHNSPAYQSWISSLKSKENEDRESHRRRDRRGNNNQFPYSSPQKSEGRFILQPMESDENEEYFSNKHLAAARYYRNNKLVNDIFSDSIISDSRNVPKVQMLRHQVDLLTVYQKKLDEELKQIEEKFQQKKHALIESSERFNQEMNKRFAPNDLDSTLKDHYRKTLIKTMELMKGTTEEQASCFSTTIDPGASSNENSNLDAQDSRLANEFMLNGSSGIDKSNENSNSSSQTMVALEVNQDSMPSVH